MCSGGALFQHRSMRNGDPSSSPVNNHNVETWSRPFFFSWTIVLCCLHIALLVAAWILLSHSDAVLWLWTWWSHHVSTHLLNPLWAARAARLRCICRNKIWVAIQTTSKCCLDLIWKKSHFICLVFLFLLSSLPKGRFWLTVWTLCTRKDRHSLFVHWSNVVLHMWAYIHDNYIPSEEPKACAVTAFSLGRNRMGSNCSSIKHNSYSQYWVTAVIVGFNCNPGSVKYSKNRHYSVSILDWHFMIQ